VERLIEVQWKWGLLHTFAEWQVRGKTYLRIPLTYYHSFRGDARNVGASRAFKKFIDNKTEFSGWWHETCGESGDKVFLLRFTDGGWHLPWEFLIKRLSPRLRPTVSLARASERQFAAKPAIFDEALRILIIKGDNGTSIGLKLNLDAEIRGVMNAYDQLESGIRKCIDIPKVADADRTSLTTVLDNYRPHILWFSGHGETKKDTRVLFCGKDWITANDFASLVGKAKNPPLYVIFWACDTADSTGMRTVPNSPPLFEELSKVNVLSVLAMQAAIRDVSAQSMAADVFRFLAAGLPIEKAISRARAFQMEDPPELAHSLDWACPVVWSNGELPDKLQWNAASQNLAKSQILGRHSMRSRTPFPAIFDAPPTEEEIQQANNWMSEKNWIHGDWQEQEHLVRWLRVLLTVQATTTLFVIRVDLRGEDPKTSLPEWAEALYARLIPGDIPNEIALIINEIARNTVVGWPKLCRASGVFLAITGIPTSWDGSWFWEPLVSADGPSAIMTSKIDQRLTNKWAIDSIGQTTTSEAIALAVNEAPDLARALAILNLPLRHHLIKLESVDVNGSPSLSSWDHYDAVLVETSAGPVISSTARGRIITGMSEAETKRAHGHCVELLGNPQITLNTELREHRLLHLLDGDFVDDALEEARILCQLYREDRMPFAVLSIIARLGRHRTDLPSSTKLVVAWAHLRLGQVDAARFWLERATMLPNALERASKHALCAEILKSVGSPDSKQRALVEIEKAISYAEQAARRSEQAPPARRLERAFRQDHARILQYLFGEKQEAVIEYEQLIAEWSGEVGAEEDLAVVKRNLAECLRTISSATDQSQRIKDLLEESEQLLANNPLSPLLAEILYERSRQAESDRDEQAAKTLLNRCCEVALASHNYLVHAVARNRYFWHYSRFNEPEWRDIEGQLLSFSPHGWAIRACWNGRLRAARQLELKGDLSMAFKELEKNLEEIAKHPSFDAGSDRFRIAATMAGLQRIADQQGRQTTYWTDFLRQYASWSNTWVNGRTPSQIWMEVGNG
jgi:tetratricopeptide (TPR) repeat protein